MAKRSTTHRRRPAFSMDRSRLSGFGSFPLIALLCLLITTACKSPLDLKALEGRWLDKDQDRHLEFTPHHLMVEVHQAPANVVAFNTLFKRDVLHLEPLSWPWLNLLPAPGGGARVPETPRKQNWPLSRKDSVLTFESQGYRWIMQKASPPETSLGRVPQNLIGLWRQLGEDGLISYFEFTPWSTLVQLTWRKPILPESHAGEETSEAQSEWLYSTAEWWEVKSPEGNVLLLEGLELEGGAKSLRATYQIDGSVLTLRIGQKKYTLRQTDRVEFDSPIKVESLSKES